MWAWENLPLLNLVQRSILKLMLSLHSIRNSNLIIANFFGHETTSLQTGFTDYKEIQSIQ